MENLDIFVFKNIYTDTNMKHVLGGTIGHYFCIDMCEKRQKQSE